MSNSVYDIPSDGTIKSIYYNYCNLVDGANLYRTDLTPLVITIDYVLECTLCANPFVNHTYHSDIKRLEATNTRRKNRLGAISSGPDGRWVKEDGFYYYVCMSCYHTKYRLKLVPLSLYKK